MKRTEKMNILQHVTDSGVPTVKSKLATCSVGVQTCVEARMRKVKAWIRSLKIMPLNKTNLSSA